MNTLGNLLVVFSPLIVVAILIVSIIVMIVLGRKWRGDKQALLLWIGPLVPLVVLWLLSYALPKDIGMWGMLLILPVMFYLSGLGLYYPILIIVRIAQHFKKPTGSIQSR